MIRAWTAVVIAFLIVAAPVAIIAQSPGPTPAPVTLTLDQALQYAVDHYPAVRAALEQVNASASGVRVAKSGYLPRLDSLWQSNRATANNVFGQTLPQSVLPALPGPVLPTSSSHSVWGSAAGALVSWEPFDFGLRRATVSSAEAVVSRARADEALTRLDVQSAVGAAFLDVVAAERAVEAARADVERRDVLARAARTMADNQLRPGAEASRAAAERAAAETRAIQARRDLMLAQARVARLLGVVSGTVAVDSANLLTALPVTDPAITPVEAHPVVQAHQAAVEVARAQEEILGRTDFPRLFLQSSVFARGSGASPTGLLDGGLDGLGLDRANWAAGVQIVFPNLFDFSSLRARRAGVAASTRVEIARHDEAMLAVAGGQREAAALVEAARAVAANTPVQLAAAQQSEAQARARYQAGLASIVEVADTQSLLAQAEFQDQAARVDVWRALLADAVAQGRLTSFLNLLPPSAGVR